jgi:pyruvate,water dikinase
VGYTDSRTYFVERLAQGIGIIAAAFYPRTVILRFSDFKTDEYENLIGGKFFEPKEANPMLGWRGGTYLFNLCCNKDYLRVYLSRKKLINFNF